MSEKIIQKDTTKVRVELKFVKNLGNYESMHVDIGVEDFVRDTDDNTGDAVDRVYDFVLAKLIEKVQDIKDQLDD